MEVLKLKKHNEKKEIDFEIRFLLSLSTKERFQMMIDKSEQLKRLMRRGEDRKTTKVIKRV